MNKKNWMMMGVTAVVCSALFAPGAFAKEKDDSYSVTNPTIFAPGPNTAPVVKTTEVVQGFQQTGPAFIFPSTLSEKEEK